MITAADIVAFLDTLAPQSEKEPWDNVGFLVGSRRKEVRTILVALDPFEDAAEEAARIGADLLVTHHPLIFHPLSAVTEDNAVGRTVISLIRNDIGAINAHTNLDCAPGGVNDVLAATLGLSEISVINPTHTDANGGVWGLLRMGTVEETSLDAFLATVKSALGCEGLRYVSGGKPVHRVAVGGGACASELMDAVKAGCDTFVTSDVKYNQFWDAHDMGLNLIDAGHFYTENPICTVLRDKLATAFPDISVVISQSHRDCMKFF